MDIGLWARLGLSSGRFSEIATTLARYGLADRIARLDTEGIIRRSYRRLIDRSLSDLPHGERWKRALLELGPVFIKLGQFLAGRPDLVGEELAESFADLREEVDPLDPEIIRDRIALLLGAPVEELFANLEREPIGCGSIAQVHAARLHDGREVVVKVVRPGLREEVERDLRLLQTLADIAVEHLEDVRWMRPERLVRDFATHLRNEADLENEAANLIEFRKRFADDPRVHIPEPFRDLTRQEVLTMERVAGTPMAVMARAEDERRQAVARNGAGVLLDMIFRDGVVHGDPHPGNLRAQDDNAIGIIDFGTVLRLPEPMRRDLNSMLAAAVRQDAGHMVRFLDRIGAMEHCVDRELLRIDLGGLLARFGTDTDQLHLQEALDALHQTFRLHHVTLPDFLARLMRIIALTDASVNILHPGFGFTSMLIPYQRRLYLRSLRPDRQLRRWRQMQQHLLDIAGNLPSDFADIIARLRRGQVDVTVHHDHLAEVVNRLALGLVSTGLIIAGSMQMATAAIPTWWGVSIIGALMTLAGLAGATWLLIAIWRSGGLR